MLIPDHQIFGIVNPAVLRMERGIRWHVLQPLRERQRQSASRVHSTQQNLRDSIPCGVAEVPRVHDSPDFIHPRHRDGGPALGDDNDVRVRSRDAVHELVRAAGERKRCAIVALRLPVAVEPDYSDDDIRILRKLHGLI